MQSLKRVILFSIVALVFPVLAQSQTISKQIVHFLDDTCYYLVTTHEGKGLWNLKNEELIPCKYKSIISSYHFFICEHRIGSCHDIYLRNGKQLIFETDYYSFHQGDIIHYLDTPKQEMLFVRTPSGTGVINDEGKLIVPDIYLSVEERAPYFFICKTYAGLSALYKKDGTLVIPGNVYSEIDPLTNGRIKVKRGQYTGVCSYDGKEIIPANKYNDIVCYINAGYTVRFHSEYNHNGYLDKEGKTILDPETFDVAKYMKAGYLYAKRNDVDEYKISTDGSSIELIEKETVTPMSKKIAGTEFSFFCNENKLYGVSRDDGQIILPDKFTDIFHKPKTKQFLSYVKGTCALYDYSGNEIIPPGKYTAIDGYGKEYYKVYDKDKCGLCAINGDVLVPITEYDDIEILKDSTGYIVSKNLYKGVISTDGKEIIPLCFTNIRKKNGYFIVSMYDQQGVYDQKGTMIIQPQYSNISFEESFFRIQKGKFSGYADKEGNVIFSPDRYTITMLIPDNSIKGNYKIWAALDNDETYIYDIYGNVLEILSDDNTRRNYIAEADRLFDLHKYSEAIAYYDKACLLKEDYVVLFNIGSCYYNLNQYSNATIYLQRCINARPPVDVNNDARVMRDYCDEKIRSANSSTYAANNGGKSTFVQVLKTVGRVALAALGVASAVTSPYNPSMAQMYNDPYYYSSVYNNIMNQAVSSVEAQYQEGYNQYRQYHPEATFTDYQIFLGQAASYQSNNNMNFSTSNQSSGYAYTRENHHSEECWNCRGTGRVIRNFSVSTFGNDEKVWCNECKSYHFRSDGHTHVDCNICHGKGRVDKVSYETAYK